MAVNNAQAVAGEQTAAQASLLAQDIEALVRYAVANGLLAPEDETWAYNAVLECVGATGPAAPHAAEMLADQYALAPTRDLADPEGILEFELPATDGFDLEAVIERIAAAGVANGREEDTPSGADRIATRVMDLVMPRPSEVSATFAELYDEDGAEAATDWFYRMCCDARYVRTAAIAKNIGWTSPTQWGDLEITINLSKPEKDPKAIAAAGAAPATGDVYPACQLCMENEGYRGRGAGEANGAHPARQNLRIVPITLGGEHWGLQYSPYAYFNEHCIAMSAEHRLMHVDRENMGRLLDFVDLFPHYFVGSNADLPIVGGSILSHDHFQGGRHVFPMMKAQVASTFSMDGFPHVECSVVRWPLSVLKLAARDREQLLDAASHVLDVWRDWSDEAVGVIAESNGERHNTITPVACREGENYVLYLALRCNVTTDEHPLGVFHPHAEWHHIKKENIGLIEVMGLAILPPRLVDELGAVEQHLVELSGEPASLAKALEADALSAPHAAWALELAEAHGPITADTVEDVVRAGVGEVFGHVLEDAGVYKWDDEGRAAQQRFIDAL
ncbi:MAG TPA: UDP-glucose--hexose-1-phosphate uridylyltransferase [Enorma massiliensis]|uniref:UDP-glucose--hexose-1-phosphate uridylyltransferase n=1 Tax=Enorma massiliensis TaxID=1472761 RepID=UPI001D26CBC9|nr:UDP-glucose--hexose-1-phosphate uridylyltransferase [Enorma massiliensis]HJG61819.1 UDP-glucose--hexose-1-phosphate uridylyltransferase [Enorma massiliensis]